MKDRPSPRTVFSQTQKTKNVCLKRRFQFVGRMYKLKTPTLLPGKSSPIFTLRCVALHSASKRQTLSLQRSDQPGREVLKIIFAREQKCINNHFGLGICAGMVVTNTTFVLEKFFITVFPLKNSLNSISCLKEIYLKKVFN